MPISAAGKQSAALALGVQPRQALADDDQQEETFSPLTKQEAEAFRAKQPVYSPWRVLGAQCAAGLFLSVLMGVLGGSGWGWSALYGAAVVVLPGAVMVRGLKQSLGLPQGAVLARFAVWELAKLLLSVAMMVVAPRIVSDLSWMVLMLALVVCLKVNWAVLLFDQRRAVQRSIS
jgi:ATP synthase protein I